MSPLTYDPDHPPIIVEEPELAVTDRYSPSAKFDAKEMYGRPLSNREFQILQLVAHGSTLKDAAAECGIKVQTARKYVASLLLKTGAVTLRRAVVLYTIYAAGQ